MSKDSLPSQSTTLEALLRGEGLDKRNSSKNDEESLLEIQVRSPRPDQGRWCFFILVFLPPVFNFENDNLKINFSFQSHNCRSWLMD